MGRASPVPAWVPESLPAAPGVYAFTDSTGHSLYVGKSVNLRRRVRGYFYGGGPENQRLREMLGMARGVTTQPTGSDIEARLVEAERILDQRPPYNRALKQRGAGWYLELRWSEPFPRLRLVGRPRIPAARYVGPFWGRRLPDRVGRLVEKIALLRTCLEPVRPDATTSPCIQHDLGLCTAPCAKRVGIDEYRRQAETAMRLLTDSSYSWELRGREASARDLASRRLDFEAAAAHQVRMSWLEELEQYRFALDDHGGDRSWLIVLPGVTGEVRILQPVASGRVLRRREVAWNPADVSEAADEACYAIRVAELRTPTVLSARESVRSSMVRRWLEDGSPGGTALDVTRLGTSEVRRELLDML